VAEVIDGVVSEQAGKHERIVAASAFEVVRAND
jgi:hypothetical protein